MNDLENGLGREQDKSLVQLEGEQIRESALS